MRETIADQELSLLVEDWLLQPSTSNGSGRFLVFPISSKGPAPILKTPNFIQQGIRPGVASWYLNLVYRELPEQVAGWLHCFGQISSRRP